MFRSRTAMIHIITDAIRTAPQCTYHQCFCRFGLHYGTTGINHLDAHTHLCTERRIFLRVIPHWRIIGITLYILEKTEWWHKRFCPERISIGSRYRNGFITYYCRISPTGSRIQRSNHACLFRHFLQRTHVQIAQFRCSNLLILHTHSNHCDGGVISGRCHILSLTRITDSPRSRRMLMFILYLDTYNGTAIFVI